MRLSGTVKLTFSATSFMHSRSRNASRRVNSFMGRSVGDRLWRVDQVRRLRATWQIASSSCSDLGASNTGTLAARILGRSSGL